MGIEASGRRLPRSNRGCWLIFKDMMKILFLDIDGVLNSHRTAIAFNGHFPWSVDEEDLKLFDAVAVNLIRKLCHRTQANVVLSSSWRHGIGWEKIGDKLGIPIIDRTPAKISLTSRGQEIAHWLQDNPKVEKYAIVDDDSDMLESQLPFFVQTTIKNGMMIEHYDRLIEILGKVPQKGD